MGLRKRVYKDKETIVTADNLNDIQDAVIALEDGLFSVDNDKSGEVITITDAANRSLRSLSIFGKTTQDGTPTPDAPVDLVSVGDGGSITVNVNGENEANSITIATPNGLPGIPVSSGGNYTDANGQQWICDEVDFARGVYIKRTKRFGVSGEDTEYWTISEIQQVAGATRFDLNLTTVPLAGRKFCLCNVYASTDFANRYAEVCWCNDAETGATLQFRICTANFATIEELKDSLQANPADIIYVLATPIEIPLSDEELAAYAALRTYKDNTTVSNDASAHIELEYVVDAKKYFESLVGSSSRLIEATVE